MKAPPATAAMATTPTTTPAAMPAVFGLLDDELELLLLLLLVAVGPAVTIMVCPPTVTTDACADLVALELEAAALVDVAADVNAVDVDTESALGTVSLVPLR